MTQQIGVGNFNATEPLSAVLLDWPRFTAKVCVDYPTFLPLMWGQIQKLAQRKRGDGSYLKIMATVCLHHDKIPIRANQMQLWKIMESGFASIFQVYWQEVASAGPCERALEPTDSVFFFGSYLDLIGECATVCSFFAFRCVYTVLIAVFSLCLPLTDAVATPGHVSMGNARIMDVIKADAQNFSFSVMVERSFNSNVPLFVRSMYVKLAGILYLDQYERLDPTQSIRMSPSVRDECSGSELPRDSMVACNPLRIEVEQYMHNLDPVVHPDNVMVNILTLEVTRILHRLLVAGSFANDVTSFGSQLTDGNILLTPNVSHNSFRVSAFLFADEACL